MNRGGYTLLLIVLIVSSVALATGLNLRFQDIAESNSVIRESAAVRNFINAQSCLDEALKRLERNRATYRNDSIPIGESQCTVTVTDPDPNYIVDVTSTLASFVKILQATVSEDRSNLSLESWKELPTYPH